MKCVTPSVLATLALTLAACSDDTVTPIDAPDDAAIDAIDASSACGADFAFTGEYVDWDSTTSLPTGVNGSTWALRGAQPPRTATSSPNGRVTLCIPSGVSAIDVTQSSYVSAVFMASPDAFQTPGSFFTAKGLRTTRAPTFYQEIGLTFDATKAHVLVQKLGSPTPLSLTGGGTAFAVDNPDDLTWTAGNSGGLVLFANVDVAGGPATLSAGASFLGPSSLPLEAGKLTMTSIR